MNIGRRKRLAEILPEGVITAPGWLMKHGFARPAIDNLVKSGWLVALQHGVYVRGFAPRQWQAIVYALQRVLDTDLTVGGLTALEMQGFGHYLQFSEKKNINLFGKDKMAAWVNTLLPGVMFTWHNDRNLIGRKGSNRLPSTPAVSLGSFVVEREWREGYEGLIVSSPERAYLEVLTEVPEKISFEHADQLMQSMTSLSPRALQALLELSGNVKVKRLFFWFAERHNYPWLDKLDKTRIDFGKGNRMLMKGGKLDKKYLITVPEFL